MKGVAAVIHCDDDVCEWGSSGEKVVQKGKKFKRLLLNSPDQCVCE